MHPSGKLLLSIGADHILRVWNLVKGRQAYAVNFGKRISPGQTLNLVTWSHDGSQYAIAIGQEAEVYNVDTAAVVYAVKCPSRISCFDLSEVILLVCCSGFYYEIARKFGKGITISVHRKITHASESNQIK